MGKYRLIYFAVRGRGESIRMAFKLANVDFEDERINLADWEKTKASIPEDSLPVLVTPEGRRLVQSIAILRHLGRKFGLYGSSVEDMYAVDRALDQCMEFADGTVRPLFAASEIECHALMRKFMEEKGAKTLRGLEAFVTEGDGSVVKGKVTIADLYILNMTHLLQSRFPEHLKERAWMTRHLEMVEARSPALKKWFTERPVTSM